MEYRLRPLFSGPASALFYKHRINVKISIQKPKKSEILQKIKFLPKEFFL